MSRSLPIILITGATSGIGQYAAIALAKQGAHLILTARSKAKADATVIKILEATPSTEIDVHYGDFANLSSVAALADEIATHHARIDVLINNAGVHAFKPRVTVDGYSEMIGVNYLAPWLLTHMLRKTMRNSPPSRIITVGSGASRQAAGFDPIAALDNKESFTARGSSVIYGQTKMLNIMFSLELARQLEGTGVAVNCLCPGFNVTGLGRELFFAAPLERLLKWLNIGNPERGASIIVRLAGDPHFANATGGYYSVKGEAQHPVAPGSDSDVRQVLWRETEKRLAHFC